MYIKNYTAVILEITRKCTRACKHCMRGKAQNVTITKEIIDKLFNDAPNIEAFMLTGGEPLLEIDIIEYLCHKIIDSGYTLKNKPFGSNYEGAAIHFITNGEVLDGRIIDMLSEFCAKTGLNADFTISNDAFHDNDSSKRAYDFYSGLAKGENLKLSECSHGRISVRLYHNEYERASSTLKYVGNACDLIDSGLSQYKHGIKKHGTVRAINVLYPEYNSNRVCITKHKSVRCMIQICANGNVVPGYYDNSFAQLDALSAGNILDKPLEQILLDHNASCLCLCSEKYVLSMLHNIDHLLRFDETERIKHHIVKWMTDRTFELRYKAKDLFPYLQAQDVIDAFPLPRRNVVDCLIDIIYDKAKTKYSNAEIRAGLNKNDLERLANDVNQKKITNQEANKRLQYLIVRWWLENEPNLKVYLSKDVALCSTDSDILDSPAFIKLKDLNEEYKIGNRIQSNDKVYDCNMKQDYNIDALVGNFDTSLMDVLTQNATIKAQEKQALMEELRRYN